MTAPRRPSYQETALLAQVVVADRDDLEPLRPARRAERDAVANACRQQRPGERRTPRDARVAGVELVDADDRDLALLAGLVRDRDRGAEAYPIERLAGVVHDDGFEAHALRLALIYAAIDGVVVLDLPHLEAALAIVRYAEQSAKFLFGEALGDATADAILAALKRTRDGLPRAEINELFSGHTRSQNITRALEELAKQGLARVTTETTRGRPPSPARARTRQTTG